MKGLIIKQPFVDLILQGTKTWEIRGDRTHIRGKIGVIASGTGLVFGTVELVDCVEIIDDYTKYKQFHCSQHSISGYKQTFAWVLQNPIRFAQPQTYTHKPGCVIWVNLDSA